MRDIRFRGKKKSDNQWIIGDLNHIDGKVFIFNREDGKDNLNSPDDYEVIPETVGQFIGLKDKEGNDIYDGDICISLDGVFVVKWNNEAAVFMACSGKEMVPFNWFTNIGVNTCEKIGNIHDNLELL